MRLCIVIALAGLALVAGRIAVVRASTGEVPILSANDRSRWATVASLVDFHTYQIDYFQQIRDPKTKRRAWQSIDRVQHRGRDGKIHDYSSKPPLLATMVAGVYAAIKSVTGLGIQQHPFEVIRITLAIVNLPLLAIIFAAAISLVTRHARTAYAAVFLTLGLCFGTLLTPFSVSLNNHLPAAAAAVLALWTLDTQARRGASYRLMLVCGLSLGFAVANELPALSILPLGVLAAGWLDLRKTLLSLIPGLLLVAVAFFATNWLAHESWRPPYTHRGPGEEVARIDLAADGLSSDDLEIAQDGSRNLLGTGLRQEISDALGVSPDVLQITPSRKPQRLRIETPDQIYLASVADRSLVISISDDWYDYPGTYWSDSHRTGVDRGEESRLRYAVHVLVGHHGIFSLTPLWLLSLVAVGFWFRDANRPGCAYFPRFPLWAAGSIALVSLVCIAFYLARPQIDRNYGGVSTGFRWLLWLAPLWIFLAIPVVDRLASGRWGRVVCGVCLAASLFTVSTAIENPWVHPWMYRLMDNLGWIGDQ
jgi:hypothetical protein